MSFASEDLKDKSKKPKKTEIDEFKMLNDDKLFDKFDKKDKYDKDSKYDKDAKFEKDKYKTEKDKAKDKDKQDKEKDKDKYKDKEDKYKDKAKDGKDNKFKVKDKEKKEKDKDKKEKGEKFNKGGKDKVIKDSIKRKKKKPTARSTWATYIHKVLKTVHEDDCTLSSKAMQILDSFANDLFERISTEAVKLLRLNNKRTLTSMEIQTAARLVLPGELCKHAIQDGAKAVSKYQLADP